MSRNLQIITYLLTTKLEILDGLNGIAETRRHRGAISRHCEGLVDVEKP